MNEELLNQISILKENIVNSDEYRNLLKAEKEMEQSNEVMILSYKKDMAIVDYEDALKHYSRNSIEVLKAEKILSETAYNLNQHPLVKSYKENLDKLNQLYEEIDKIIFTGIKDA
ncbi:MAG: YlbF family regulator [Candidatus Onthovivens sp.]|nr:YlbF family regulator [Candidatus Onthovivens sp.]